MKLGSIYKIFLLAMLMGSFGADAFAQCNNFHVYECRKAANRAFKYNGQSKSAYFEQGQKSELSIVVYKGQDYRVSLCSDIEVLGDKIEFRVFEKKTIPEIKEIKKVTEEQETEPCEGCTFGYDADYNECEDCLDGERLTGKTVKKEEITKKKVYTKKKVLLYDNTSDDYAQEIEFSAATTKKLIIEVVVPVGESASASKNKLTPSDMACLGLLIEQMATPKGGF
jgi:hypothetical protein